MQDVTSDRFASDLLIEADRLHQSGCSGAALDILSKGLKWAPQEQKLYYARIEILLAAEQYEKALHSVEALPDRGFDTRRAELKAECLERIGRFEEASDLIDQILEHAPNSDSALNLKGLILAHQQEFQSAIQYFEKSLSLAPDNGRALINLGLLTLERGSAQDAIEMMKKGFLAAPHIKEVATSFHEIICEIGAFATAEEMFRNACRQYPLNKRLAYLFIDILIQQDKLSQAMKAIETSMATFGIDDGILRPALIIRNRLAPAAVKSKRRINGSLSLCMIVKDEERNLARCLESVKAIVDEIVVVDTGSRDRSMDIATVFGARVFQFDWAYDFATARNFALSKATAGWILILDADEVISDRDGARVLDTFRQTAERSLAFSFVTRNYTNDVGTEGWQANSGVYQNEQAGKGWYPSQKVRLFPNLNSIRFENSVHELVEPCLRRLGIPIETCPIPIHHYGTLDKLKGARKRAEYYFLGKEKITNSRKNPAALVEHAIQAQEMGEYHEALDQWNQVLAQCPDLPQAYFNLSYVYIHLARYDKGVEAARKALELDPALKEAALNYALCQIRIGDIKSAIQDLERFLQNYPDHPMGFGLLAIASVIDNKADRGLELFEKLHRQGFNCSEYIFEQAHKLKTAGQDKAADRLLAAIAGSRFDNERLRSMRADRVGGQVVSRH